MPDDMYHEPNLGDTRREEGADSLQAPHRQVFDMENVPQQGHHFVRRGLKLSCETAAHPYHEVTLRREPMQQA